MKTRIDKEKLDRLMSLSDEELWGEIERVCSRHRISLPKGQPPKAELDRLRALASSGRIGVADALSLLNEYKKKCGGG